MDVERMPVAVRSRIKSSGLPVRFRGLELVDLTFKTELKVDAYLQHLLEGRIIRASGYPNSCGKGLYFTGTAETALSVFAAMAQRAMLEPIQVLYREVDVLLENEKPGEERMLEPDEVDILIIAGLGDEYRTESEWAVKTIGRILRTRYNEGLPTWVWSRYNRSSMESQYKLAGSPFFHSSIL